MAAKPSVQPDSIETSVKPASEANSIKKTEIPEKEKNEERNAPIRNTDTVPSQHPDPNLPVSSQSEETSSNLQRVEDASVNGQSTPVFINRNLVLPNFAYATLCIHKRLLSQKRFSDPFRNN